MKYNSKAVRISDVILQDIRSGHFEAGKYLPGEDTLAERYDVSRTTIRRVLEILNHDGVLIKKPNHGSIITPTALQETPQRISMPRTLTFAWAYAAYPDNMICNVSSGIQSYVEEHNINLQILTSTTGHEPVLNSIENAANLGVNGIILLSYVLDSYIDAIHRVVASGIPVVTIPEIPQAGCSSVCGDDAGGAFTAIRHLLSRHNRPCYFLGPTDETGSCIERYRSYCIAMREAGFDAEIESHTLALAPDGQNPDYWPLEQKELHPREVCRKILGNLEFPASVFCINDYIARGLYLAAEEADLLIGKDLMVVGYGDLPFTRRLNPALTTLRTDSVKIGYQAAHVVHQHVTGELTSPVNLRMPAEFFVRASS